MPRFLVIHSPMETEDEAIRRPTEMVELARALGAEDASPRWLRTWSPDLEDDRIFTLWDARSPAEISDALTKYGFLDHMQSQALRVQEWGPGDVLAVEPDAADDAT